MQQFYQRHQCTFSSSSVLLCTSLNEKTEKEDKCKRESPPIEEKGGICKHQELCRSMQHFHSCSQRMKSSLEQRPGTWRGLAIVVDPGYPCSIDYHTLPLLVPLSLVEKSLAERLTK